MNRTISEADMNEAADKRIAAYEAQKAIWERTRGEMEVSAVAAYAIASSMAFLKTSGALFGFNQTNQTGTVWAHPVDKHFMKLLGEAHNSNEPVVVRFDTRYLNAQIRRMVTAWLDAKFLAPAYVMQAWPEKAQEVAKKVIELSDKGVSCSIHRNGEIFVFGGDLDELDVYVDVVRQLNQWMGKSSGSSCLLYSPADMALLRAVSPGTPHVWYTTSLNKPDNTVTCATFESHADWLAYQVSLLDKPNVLPFESGELYTHETRSTARESRKRERTIPRPMFPRL